MQGEAEMTCIQTAHGMLATAMSSGKIVTWSLISAKVFVHITLQCVAVVLQLCCSCVAVRCSALQCITMSCSALQCVAVRCSALQCIAVHWCVAVRCSSGTIGSWSLPSHKSLHHTQTATYHNTLPHTATHCNALQVLNLSKSHSQSRTDTAAPYSHGPKHVSVSSASAPFYSHLQ